MRIFTYINQDHRHYFKKTSCLHFIYRFYTHQGFKIVTYFRFCQYLDQMGGGFSVLAKIICNRISVIYSIDFSPNCQIAEGLLFDHAGPRVINPSAIIGKHCMIHPNVLIGGDRGKGTPIIGDNVFIGNGAKIIGNCRIEDWCFISPGAIITKDIPEGSLVGAGLNCILNQDGKKHVLMYYNG